MRVSKICLARPLLESQKKFSRRQMKNPFLRKVAQCSGDEKKYIQYDKLNSSGKLFRDELNEFFVKEGRPVSVLP